MIVYLVVMSCLLIAPLVYLYVYFSGVYTEGRWSRKKIHSIEDAIEVWKRLPRPYLRKAVRDNLTLGIRTPVTDPVLRIAAGYYEDSPRKRIILKKSVYKLVALHEFGHYVDDSLGRSLLSERITWNTAWNISKKHKSFFLFNRVFLYWGMDYAHDAGQFFAESFAWYYFSDLSRARLKKLFPEVHDYFVRLEALYPRS